MLRPQTILRASKSLATRTAVRHNSSAASKATAAASGVVSKVTGLVNCTVFWAKVVGELAKQVYIKEGLAPPTQAQLKQVADLLQAKAKEAFLNPGQTIEALQKNKVQAAVKVSIATIQILGLFSLGEIVGRRHVVGYKHH